ncbi:hypothetical protein EMPS_08142 [Entomortierella parvispora]|uniref:CipC-like antibiotic response protein n=1 Tax=Entomortierella parvispora TaxID=205924 RepID=A0A9P3HFI2_9FUNG|nr:hypothetical protein EMPS_08142 [Entomortierella parvispora]
MFGSHQDAYDQVYGGKTHHSKWSHELVAGAAAFAAMKKHEASVGGKHSFTKEVFAGMAGAEADKLFETKGLDALDRQRAKHEAEQQANIMYDQQYGN